VARTQSELQVAVSKHFLCGSGGTIAYRKPTGIVCRKTFVSLPMVLFRSGAALIHAEPVDAPATRPATERGDVDGRRTGRGPANGGRHGGEERDAAERGRTELPPDGVLPVLGAGDEGRAGEGCFL